MRSKKTYSQLKTSISQVQDLINNSKTTIRIGEIEHIERETLLFKRAVQSFYQLKKSIKDWEKAYVLKSSIHGKSAFLTFWNTHQNVKKGDLIFTIIPIQYESFIGKAKVVSNRSGKIKPGQKVQIRLNNYPTAEFGDLNGSVKSISLVPDEKGNYLVDIELPKQLITSYNKEIQFKQEMSGAADIVTEDLRLLERLLYQLKLAVSF